MALAAARRDKPAAAAMVKAARPSKALMARAPLQPRAASRPGAPLPVQVALRVQRAPRPLVLPAQQALPVRAPRQQVSPASLVLSPQALRQQALFISSFCTRLFWRSTRNATLRYNQSR